MRAAGDDAHGRRLRALIVIPWRAGLRMQEALAFGEADLDERRGAVLVRWARTDGAARSKETARRLSISTKTVEAHVSAVLRKLRLCNWQELSRWASRGASSTSGGPSRPGTSCSAWRGW